MKRVEKDTEGGWIARRRDGSIIPDDDFRWNSRSVARDVVRQDDWLREDGADVARQQINPNPPNKGDRPCSGIFCC